MEAPSFGVALMMLNEELELLISHCGAYRTKMIEEHGFSVMAAEACAIHMHAKLLDLMLEPVKH